MNLPADRKRWPARYKELFEERAGIMEHLGNLSEETAEARAEQDIRKLAAVEPRKDRSA